MPFTKQNASGLGRRGGQSTVAKHGNDHMKQIAKKGFEATTKKYFHGSRTAHIIFLRELGAWAYFQMTQITMKRDADGRGIWPEAKPTHPAHLDPKDNVPF